MNLKLQLHNTTGSRAKEAVAPTAHKAQVSRPGPFNGKGWRRILGAVLCSIALTLGLGVTPAHAGIDGYCTHTKIKFNDHFTTYWTAEGVGQVAWRVAADLDVYDFCNHAGIVGYVSIYQANVRAEKGFWHVGNNLSRYSLNYSRSSENVWRDDLVRLVPASPTATGAWYQFRVVTDNNIGLTRQTYFDHIKVPTFLIFNGVPGAGRRETCTRQADNTWSCRGHMGT